MERRDWGPAGSTRALSMTEPSDHALEEIDQALSRLRRARETYEHRPVASMTDTLEALAEIRDAATNSTSERRGHGPSGRW